MEVSVTQENLSRSLNAVSRVASSKASLPILGNVLIRTEGNRLLVAATNLEIASTFYIGAKVIKQGSITLPAKLVSEFISSLPKGIVDLSVNANKMTISSGSYKSIINGIEADEFPELPAIDEKTSIHYTIETNDFKQAVSQTIITTSSDSTRPVLTGVYWYSNDGYVYLAATDGYRLSERRLVKTESDVAAIVPTSSLQEVMRTVNEGITEIDVLFDETQVRFRVGDAEITSRLIDGNYPDYRQLIPEQSETSIELKSSDFIRTVKIAGLFARESGGSITINASSEDGQVSIHSIASELGENTSSVEAKVTGDGQVTLNSRYLSEALGAIDGDTVIFRFSGKLSPCILESKGKDVNYLHIIMPLKS